MVPLAVGDFLLVNHEGNKTDKKDGRERQTERGREIFRFSEVFRRNRGIIVPWGYNEKPTVGCPSKTHIRLENTYKTGKEKKEKEFRFLSSAHEHPLQLFVPSLRQLSDNSQRNHVAVSVFSVTSNCFSLNGFAPCFITTSLQDKTCWKIQEERVKHLQPLMWPAVSCSGNVHRLHLSGQSLFTVSQVCSLINSSRAVL